MPSSPPSTPSTGAPSPPTNSGTSVTTPAPVTPTNPGGSSVAPLPQVSKTNPGLPQIEEPPKAIDGARTDGKLGSPTLDIKVDPASIIQTAKLISDHLSSLDNQLIRVDLQVSWVKPPAQDQISTVATEGWRARVSAPSDDAAYTSVISKFYNNLHEMLETLHAAAIVYKKTDAEMADAFKALGKGG